MSSQMTYTCDWCYEDKPHQKPIVDLRTDGEWWEHKTWEICEECRKAFKFFIESLQSRK